jgi:hypothetical protein
MDLSFEIFPLLCITSLLHDKVDVKYFTEILMKVFLDALFNKWTSFVQMNTF